MIKEIKLPEVSDNVETGDVLKVLVNVGDKIEIDQPLVELETEKATFEVPSTESGIVKEIKVKQGDIIKIGAVIVTVETNGESENKDDGKNDGESDEKKEGKADKKKDKQDEKTDGKKDEKEEKSDDEKDKKEEKSDDEKDEKEEKSDDEKDEKEEKSDDEKDEKEEKSDDEKDEKEEKSDEEKDMKENEKAQIHKDNISVSKNSAPASPSVRRLARELGVEINLITGSDEGGRITEDDIKAYVRSRMSTDPVSGVSIVQKNLPDFKKWGEIEIQSMSKIRSITADAMTYAWTSIPMVTQFDKADITLLEEFRKKNSKKIEAEGGHLTITSILVKVCEAALKTFPQFNSSIDLQKKEVVYKKYFNIGVAVDTDRGLLVPVIKNTDEKNITQISKELNELAEKARTKKITPDEMDGGNFTISNLGGIGGTNFTPIVYSPQVAILGVSRGNKEQVFTDVSFEARTMLPLSLTYDHRIIDGADAARFLRWVCETLEYPLKLTSVDI